MESAVAAPRLSLSPTLTLSPARPTSERSPARAPAFSPVEGKRGVRIPLLLRPSKILIFKPPVSLPRRTPERGGAAPVQARKNVVQHAPFLPLVKVTPSVVQPIPPALPPLSPLDVTPQTLKPHDAPSPVFPVPALVLLAVCAGVYGLVRRRQKRMASLSQRAHHAVSPPPYKVADPVGRQPVVQPFDASFLPHETPAVAVPSSEYGASVVGADGAASTAAGLHTAHASDRSVHRIPGRAPENPGRGGSPQRAGPLLSRFPFFSGDPVPLAPSEGTVEESAREMFRPSMSARFFGAFSFFSSRSKGAYKKRNSALSPVSSRTPSYARPETSAGGVRTQQVKGKGADRASPGSDLPSDRPGSVTTTHEESSTPLSGAQREKVLSAYRKSSSRDP